MTNTTNKQIIIERIMLSQTIFEYMMKMIWMMMLLLTNSGLIRKDNDKLIKILFIMIRYQINKFLKVLGYLKMWNEFVFMLDLLLFFYFSLFKFSY